MKKIFAALLSASFLLSPVVASEEQYGDYGTPWQADVRTDGKALGKSAEAEELIKGIEDRAKEINPNVEVISVSADYDLNKQVSQVDSFIAAQGGTIELGTGGMIFDRPEEAPKIDLTVRTAFGMIGVRGTKFFAGPNRGVFAVFVERGSIRFEGSGVAREVGAGQGIDVPPATGVPGEVGQWGEARIREAYASIGVR